MAEFANVIAVNYKPGNATIDLVVALLKGIDNAARNGNADFGLRCTLTYVSVNNTVETLDTGRLSIGTQTTLLGTIDGRTVSIDVSQSFGTTPQPSTNPSYSATAQVFHRDSATGLDIELGPAEQTFP